jgi:glycosyltransferase involved in cell wall biosynthesis
MDWQPNEDGVLHFIDAILPLVRRARPRAALTVVGRNPGERLRRAAEAAGVRVTGTVEDVRPHLGAAAVMVVPLRVGGGTRLKIFEGLAMGKAVVSTAIGAEGLPLEDGVHFLCADRPEVFAAAVLRLLDDAGLRRRLGAAGRRLVEERYGWPRVALAFEDLLEGALNDAAPAAAPLSAASFND